MQTQTKKGEEQRLKSHRRTKRLPIDCIDRKDKCQDIYKFNCTVIYDSNKYVLIKDYFEDVYRFWTILGSYCCIFHYLFLKKYRNLFFPEINYNIY